MTAQSPGARLIESSGEEVFHFNVHTAKFWNAFILMDSLQWGGTALNVFRLIIAFQILMKRFLCKLDLKFGV